MYDDDKPSLEDAIEHFGIKGMHWGSRKAQDNTPNSSYKTSHRSQDTSRFGKSGSNRINRDLNSGKNRQEAVKAEHRRRMMATIAVGLSASLIVLATTSGGVPARNIASHSNPITTRGALAAQSIFRATQNTRGVHTITSLR